MERDKKCNYTVTGNQAEMVKKKCHDIILNYKEVVEEERYENFVSRLITFDIMTTGVWLLKKKKISYGSLTHAGLISSPCQRNIK